VALDGSKNHHTGCTLLEALATIGLSLIIASALRGGLMSRINDDMLVGAIATSASLWITGITIAVCYLMIRR
jgi:hypothetical protein